MFQSEYLAECDERIKYISGFSGSNGICVVTHSNALMWTDGRYYLQAGKQLEAGWEMQKMEPGILSYFEWISTNLKAGEKIGVDPSQIGAGKHITTNFDIFQPVSEIAPPISKRRILR